MIGKILLVLRANCPQSFGDLQTSNWIMIEIERKFLIKDIPELNVLSTQRIQQGYLTAPNDSLEVRLRRIDNQYFITVKTGEGLVRGEREISINKPQFDKLWPLVNGKQLEKKRISIFLENGLMVEIDFFEGNLAPLIMCEIEFSNEDEANNFDPPKWFGKEVTTDNRYKNKSLVINGCPV